MKSPQCLIRWVLVLVFLASAQFAEGQQTRVGCGPRPRDLRSAQHRLAIKLQGERLSSPVTHWMRSTRMAEIP